MSRLSGIEDRRENRVTMWPAAYGGDDIELAAPWPGRFGMGRASKRWTGAFDIDGRASRMSMMAGDTLLPPSPGFQHRWTGAGNRKTFMNEVENNFDNSFPVEKRVSFMKYGADSPYYSEDFEEELEKKKDVYKAPPTEEQLKQANTELVSPEVLKYDFAGYGTPENPYLVKWMENDPANPLQYSSSKKWTNAMVLALAVHLVSIASSGFSQGVSDIMSEFKVGQSTALLMTSLFVLGFAIGALGLSPLSEVYGRRDLYVWTFAAFVLTSGVVGLSPNITVILVLRLAGGLAGSFTQSVAPAVIADMFQAQERGFVLSIFTLAGLMGQMLGPIACGFLDHAYGWRSLAILIAGSSLPVWIALTVTFPETYAPVLLKRRAKKLSEITGQCYVVDGMQDEKTIGTQLRVGALRPWVILIYEPIVTLLSLFLSVVHATLFFLFAAYPIVYQQVRGWPQGVASLPFLAIALGIILSLVYVAAFDQKRYAKVVDKNNGFAPPEARLPPAMLGSVALPVGLFWFAWTNSPDTFWLISVSAGVFFGFGMVLLYMSLTNYIVDAYLAYAASALAASTVLRSVAAAILPLFTTQMYNALGIHWASSVPGFMALIFVPTLVAFYKFGHIIRSKTRFAAAMMDNGDGK